MAFFLFDECKQSVRLPYMEGLAGPAKLAPSYSAARGAADPRRSTVTAFPRGNRQPLTKA